MKLCVITGLFKMNALNVFFLLPLWGCGAISAFRPSALCVRGRLTRTSVCDDSVCSRTAVALKVTAH